MSKRRKARKVKRKAHSARRGRTVRRRTVSTVTIKTNPKNKDFVHPRDAGLVIKLRGGKYRMYVSGRVGRTLSAGEAHRLIEAWKESSSGAKDNPRRRKRRIARRRVRVVSRRRPHRKRSSGAKRRTPKANYVGIRVGGRIQLCRVSGSKLHRMGTYTRTKLKKWAKSNGVKMR